MTVYSPAEQALACVNWGRWLAECPGGCGSAEPLEPGQSIFRCSNCKHITQVTWPDDPAGIWRALGMRVLKHRRNWYPKGHQLAVMAGLPHGQSVADLMAETAAHETDTEA